MSRVSRFLAAALLFALVFIPEAGAATADSFYTAGARLYSDGNYAEAEKYFVKALQANKRHTSSMFMLAETISKDVRRLNEAEGWYKKTLASARNDKSITPRALFSIGKLYILLGRQEEAIDSFKKLLSQYPDFYEQASVYNNMGVAEYRLERYDRALECFKTALKHDPGLLEATFNMKNVQNQLSILNIARYHQRMGDNTAAIAQYNSALDRYPNYVAAWYQLGLLYIGEGKWDEALRHLQRAQALNHGFATDKEMSYQIARAYAGRGGADDTAAAIKLFDSIQGYKDTELREGEVYLGTGDYARAEQMLTSVADGKAERKIRAEANYQLGLIYVKKNDHDNAAEHFQAALSLAPQVEQYRNPPLKGFTPVPPPEPSAASARPETSGAPDAGGVEETSGFEGMDDYGGDYSGQ